MIGSPVIIEHQDVTDKNADKIRCGVISDAYFNEPDGWYYAEGIIWDDKAISLINDGWSVSCSYDFLAFNDEGGEENNIKYDKEFTELNFTHLAIVNNPRYERANIVFNSKDEDKGKWVTAKGNHIFIPDGKTLDEVIKEKGWGNKEGSKNKEYKTGDKISFDTNWRGVNPKIQKGEIVGKEKKLGSHGDANPDYQYKVKLEDGKTILVDKEAIQENKQSDSKDNKSNTEIKQSLGKAISEFYSDKVDISAKTLKELKELSGRDISKDEVIEIARQVTKDHDWDSAIKKIKKNKTELHDLVGKASNELYGDDVTISQDTLNKINKFLGTKFSDDDMNKMLSQNHTKYGNEFISKTVEDLMKKQNKTNNSKEQDMALLDELKKLIFKVENEKENKMDSKSKILSILNEKEVDKETIEEIKNEIEKMEEEKEEVKNKKKVKNEEEEIEEKEEVKNKKKVKNEEDEEDEEKVEELKKEEKKDVENKCKNSKETSTFDKINAIYNSVRALKPQTKYTSRQEKLDNAVEYFKN